MSTGEKIYASVQVRLGNGTTRSYLCPLSAEDARNLAADAGSKRRTELSLFKRVLSADQVDDGNWRSFSITLTTADARIETFHQADPKGGKPARDVGRCRSLLGIARIVLPREIYNDAIDEWMDEIECAAAEDRPALRRAASILIRSMPVLALRSRMPRVRRRGSE